MATLDPKRRSLTTAERRLLRLRVRDLESKRDRSGRVLQVGAALLAYCDSHPRLIKCPDPCRDWFLDDRWCASDFVDTARRRRERQHIDAVLNNYRSAMQANEADVYHVKARAYVEFEEIEDEGACFAFELQDDRVVFLQGQQFYPSAMFPSLDFDLVHLLDDAGQVVDEHLEKRGQQVEPLRVIPSDRKRTLVIPEHLEVVDAHLERIEDALDSST